MSQTDLFNNAAAADTSIGFDYQYYYFLYSLLGLSHGESIGLEVRDDIHLERNGRLILIQTKHSVQSKADGTIINLTERDVDLWKTLYNWIVLVNEKTRLTTDLQVSFIKNTEFVLVSNKSKSLTNAFFVQVAKLNSGVSTYKDFKEYLEDLYNNTTDSDSNKALRNYMAVFMKQKKEWLISFLKQLRFDLGEDDLIERIKTRILEKIYEKSRVDDVFHCLDSSIRKDNYLTTKSKGEIVISFDVFMQKYRGCFKKGFSSVLPVRKDDYTLPEKLLEQKFIQQLIDIGDIDSTDSEKIIQFTKFKLVMFNNLKRWRDEGDLLENQETEFINDCINKWNNKFTTSHRSNVKEIKKGAQLADIDEGIKEAALNCLDGIRELLLQIEEDKLDSEMSNGQFYLLADEMKIGWHLDWKNRYK